MARTHNEILDSIRADFVANVTLQEAYGLDPEVTFLEQFSKTSIEAIWTYIVASAIYLHELIIDKKQTEIETTIANKQSFSIPWYKANCLKFQYGDTLVFNEETYRFEYAAEDSEKQIVQNASVRTLIDEGVSKLQVFITKSGKAALTADELAAFKAYYNQTGAPGTHFDYVSLAPDQLTIDLTIVYDPQLIDSNGLLLSDGVTTPVNDAVDTYLDNIKYSGKFNRTKFIDQIQAASGVFDAVLGDVLMNGEAANAQLFESPSGFFEAATINVTYTPGNSDDY